jgi:hypothetical protein
LIFGFIPRFVTDAGLQGVFHQRDGLGTGSTWRTFLFGSLYKASMWLNRLNPPGATDGLVLRCCIAKQIRSWYARAQPGNRIPGWLVLETLVLVHRTRLWLPYGLANRLGEEKKDEELEAGRLNINNNFTVQQQRSPPGTSLDAENSSSNSNNIIATYMATLVGHGPSPPTIAKEDTAAAWTSGVSLIFHRLNSHNIIICRQRLSPRGGGDVHGHSDNDNALLPLSMVASQRRQ